MDPAYIPAIAALAGSAIGAMTSLGASWLTLRAQLAAQERASDFSRREALYEGFIEEAAKLYADAYEHDQGKASTMVNLYAMIGKMRVLSSPAIVEAADNVARLIIRTYMGPNKTLRDVIEVLDNEAMNPFVEFSNACRQELRGEMRSRF
jgi:hypothetical protein